MIQNNYQEQTITNLFSILAVNLCKLEIKHAKPRNKWVNAIVLAITIVFSLSTKVSAQEEASDVASFGVPIDLTPQQQYHSQRILVRFNTSNALLKNEFPTLLNQVGLKTIKRIPLAANTSSKVGTNSKVGFDIHVLEIIEIGKSVKNVIRELNQSNSVMYAEPDYVVYANATPNDPRFEDLWGLHNNGTDNGKVDADIDAPEVWNITTGNAETIVGVIDSGVDYNHPDLRDNMWVNSAEIADNNIDDDGNGYVDDIHGINCNSDSLDPFDDNRHGTHVAGIIAAKGNNNIGVVGVNWTAKIMALKFLGSAGVGNISGAIECLSYATMMKNRGVNIRLTNNSWGGGGFSRSLSDAIEASGDAGMLFVAAAGNNAANNDSFSSFPSGYPLQNVIAVAATDRNDDLSPFSSYGSQTVDLGAPGSSILSTIPGGHYASFSGTSMASPYVAGAAALLWSRFPQYSAHTVKNLLMATGDPIPALLNKTVSGKRLNVNNAMNCTLSTTGLALSLLSPYDDFKVYASTKQVQPITAYIHDRCGLPILGREVTATVMNSDGKTKVFALKDDGIAPDTVSGDGRYSSNWGEEKPGEVKIRVVSGSLSATTHGETFMGKPATCSSHPYEWRDTSSAIVMDNEAFLNSHWGTQISIGFTFKFYGSNIYNAFVSRNGLLTFNGGNKFPINHYLPYRYLSGFTPMIVAPLWDNWMLDGESKLSYMVTGKGIERSLTVSWENVHHGGEFVHPERFPGDTVSFQVTLHENTGNIEFVYKDVNSSEEDSIGVRGGNATVGAQSNTEPFYVLCSSNEPVLTDRSAILISFSDLLNPQSPDSDDGFFVIPIQGRDAIVLPW